VEVGEQVVKTTVCVAVLLTAWWLPVPAMASTMFGDADVRDVSLKVNAAGVALVEYRTQSGRERHVLVWGAINALAHPTDQPSAQQKFRIDYSGGWKSRQDSSYWRKFENVCRSYDGPALPLLVAACRAPDGSYWALQSWQRNLPMRGFEPWTEAQRAHELHVSHWSGPLPVLEVYGHWTYGRTKQGFFGRLTYRDEPVYGTRSPSARVADPWARNVYIDTYNSDFGPGWRHDTAITTHSGSGGFCYTFVAQAPPSGYPSEEPKGNGLGEKYRVTVMGPGVTPVVQWEGTTLARSDPDGQSEAAQRFEQILGNDEHCAPERSA
jgi:hypothetical protein